MILLAAISLGFLGSFHCIGMCGPIALSIPVSSNSRWGILASALMYNSGRILTYAVMGLLFGLIGTGFAMTGLQNFISIAMGILIITFMIMGKSFMLKGTKGFAGRMFQKLKTAMARLFASHSQGSVFIIGILNGLLPCGLVYLAIAASIATAQPLEGALFMAGFGLGTLPAMLGVGLIRNLVTIEWRQRMRKTVPLFAGLMAVMLILRGLNLGIPYVSPGMVMEKDKSSYNCCHK